MVFPHLQKPIVHNIPVSYSVISCWQFEIGNGGSVYTMEIRKCFTSFFMEHHCQPTIPEKSLLVTNDHKAATSNGISVHLFWTSVISDSSSLLSSWNAFFSWTPWLSSPLVLQLLYWPLFFGPLIYFLFISPASKYWVVQGSILSTLLFSISTHSLDVLTQAGSLTTFDRLIPIKWEFPVNRLIRQLPAWLLQKKVAWAIQI